MKHNDMKNRISLTLKDPILQAEFRNNGFTVSAMTEQQLKIALEKGEQLEKENAELEEKISVLLSCKNCPENKGGFICQKEYENKCLAQKIQFIKELQQEIADLKAKNKWYSEQICNKKCAEVWGNLDKARELLAKWVELFKPKLDDFPKPPIQVDTEKFLKEVSK